MKLIDIYKKLDYTPPMGGIEIISNVNLILNSIYDKGYSGSVELTRKEFISVFTALKDEILVSMLLSKGKTMNDYFTDGTELRGLTIKITDENS